MVELCVMELRNGVRMPSIGFGTAFGLRSPETTWSALPVALECGFTHVDTAAMYGNERHIGDVLGRQFADKRLSRSDIFVSTKVSHPPMPSVVPEPSRGETEHMLEASADSGKALQRQFFGSLERLGLGYVDLLLIHWPGPRPGEYDETAFDAAKHNRRKRHEMWKALEFLLDKKLTRAIGVSNFTKRHLEELLSDGVHVVPHVNQMEVHPYLSQEQLRQYCAEKGIVLNAFSPLARGRTGLLDDPTINKIAQTRQWSSAQVVLRWLLQRGIASIPKSSSNERMADNLATEKLPALSDDEMGEINGLNCDMHTYPDPEAIP